MKKILYTRCILAVLLICSLITACDKFPLIKNESLEPTVAGANLKGMTIWEYISMDDFHAKDKTNIGTFGKAVEYAGLKDMLNGEGNYTVLILDNTAMAQLFERIGYKGSPMSSIPPIMIRNMLLNNIIADARVRSLDLAINETKKYKSLSSDTILFIRESSSLDQYLFYVNKSAAAVRQVVRNQNLEFKNGAAVVLTGLPVYDIPVSTQDNSTAVVPTDTFFVAKDAFTQNGTSKALSFSSTTDLLAKAAGTDINFERRALMQFPIRQPKFTGRIGSARIVNYIVRLDGTKGASSLEYYEDQNIDWVESTLKWSTAPLFGATAIGSTPVVTASVNKYVSADITPTVQSYVTAAKTFINVGIVGSTTDAIGIRPREVSSGTFKSYIVLSGTPTSILAKVNNNPIVIALKDGLKSIGLKDLQFSGTADKNITYVVKTLPQNGILTRNDKPIVLNATFKQDDIAKGIVNYLYTGTAAGTDSFVVEVKDFQGGYFPNLVTVPIQVQ